MNKLEAFSMHLHLNLVLIPSQTPQHTLFLHNNPKSQNLTSKKKP